MGNVLMDEGYLAELDSDSMIDLISDLTTDEKEYRRLKEDPSGVVEERLGIKLEGHVNVRNDYKTITKGDTEKLKMMLKAKSEAGLSNEILEAASNKLAVLVAVAAVGAAAYAVLWFWGPD